MSKLESNLLGLCGVGVIFLVVALSVQNWRTCLYLERGYPYTTNICVRQGLFEECTGTCYADLTYSFNKMKCFSIPWNYWNKDPAQHQSVIILLSVCLGLHFICCLTWIVAKVTNFHAILLVNAFVVFTASICGIAAMSVYTKQYGHSSCSYGYAYFFGWTGVWNIFLASFFFLAQFCVMLSGRTRPNDRTILVN